MDSVAPRFMEYNDLESSMRNQSTLEGYDVMVAYSETQLNSMLKAATDADNSVINVPEFQTQVAIDDDEPMRTYNIDLVLTKPNFAFAGPASSTSAVLSFDLGGSYKVKKEDGSLGPSHAIGPGLTLAIGAALSTVTGSVHPDNPTSRFVPASPPKNAGGDSAAALTGDSANKLTFLKTLVKAGIEDYMQKLPWCYYLAIVNNSSPGGEAGAKYKLTPTSLGFSISAGNNESDPAKRIDDALCMWITVAGGSQQAVLSPGQQCTANFSIQNRPVMPIPINHGSTAVVIFSNSLMRSLLFEKPLTDANCSSITFDPLSSENTSSIKAKFNLPSQKIHKDGVSMHEYHSATMTSHSTTRKVDPIDFDMNAYQATLTVNPGLCVSGTPIGSIEWSTDTLKISWESDDDSTSGAGRGVTTHSDDHSGTTDLVFKTEMHGMWVSEGGKGANLLDFVWTRPSTFTVTATAEQKDLSWWQRLWSSWENTVPSDLANITVNLPALQPPETSINYLLTTNILLPGKHVFVPDPLVAASKDDQKGISIPFDVLLSGTLVTQLQTDQNPGPSPHPKRMLATRPAEEGNGEQHKDKDKPASKTLADFVDMAVTLREGTIISRLYSTISGASSAADVAEKVGSLLEDNGYGNITADEAFSVLGSSSSHILNAAASPLNVSATGHNGIVSAVTASIQNRVKRPFRGEAPPAYVFDLRVFAAAYTIVEGPQALLHEMLSISRLKPAIRFLSQTVTPTMTTDTTALPHHTTVSWSTDEGSYSVVFTVTPDSDGHLALSFFGHATMNGDIARRFLGMQKTKEPSHAEVSKKPRQKHLLGDGLTNADVANIVLASIGTAAALVGLVAMILWRKVDKADKKLEKLITTGFKEVANNQKAIGIEAARQAAQEVIEKPPVLWDSPIRDLIQTATTSTLDSHLTGLTLEQLEECAGEKGDSWTALVEAGEQKVRDEVNKFVTTTSKEQLVERFDHFVTAQWMTLQERDATVNIALDNVQFDKVTKLTQESAGNPCFLFEAARGRVAHWQAQGREKLADELLKKGDNLSAQITEAEAVLNRKVEVFKEQKKFIDDSEKLNVEGQTDPQLVREMKKVHDELDKEIDALENTINGSKDSAARIAEDTKREEERRAADERMREAKSKSAERALREGLR
ncbi:hypothetical protein B0T16DRAFT_453736 [Cercophora newfieldiana]|uniref:Uncharacterized protein n=1 Tax=Cercophora newfieldiana TaxID=92897 RepID=A0AA39YEM5_9PEZI|nr:hypothetical protein B0T16DRAFT_453736 [Cercophora newfieldiana]